MNNNNKYENSKRIKHIYRIGEKVLVIDYTYVSRKLKIKIYIYQTYFVHVF